MKSCTENIAAVDLIFTPVNIGGRIGLAESGQVLKLEFDNPNQIESLIHGLQNLSAAIANYYEGGEAHNDI